MSRQLVLPGSRLDIAADPKERWYALAREAIEHAAEHELARNTRASYLSSLRAWRVWAAEYCVDPMPPFDPEAVLAWCQYQASVQGVTHSTIQARLAALQWIDAWSLRGTNEARLTLRQDPRIKRWAKADRVTRGTRPRRRSARTAITQSDVRAILRARDHLATTEGHRLRDRALLLTMYFAAMRRSEIADLHVGSIERTDRGLCIHIDRSKTDQEGVGAEVVILTQEDRDLCAARAWDAWLGHYALYCGGVIPDHYPAFPSLERTPPADGRLRRLSTKGLYEMFKLAARTAGVDASPHSFRAAFATHASELHDENEIAAHGRWRSRTVLARYVRRSRQWKRNPTAGISGPETSPPFEPKS